ncbi:hypothetical protein F0562_010642 [Nyssa sinensis]|uniref:Uncharacterized protein n=1 Tax=Nyssa sinensis TaxID=561372 RepID=A0A5J5A1Y7_9ASTE|nr:hypothetical protein F0562_010642 [Nyssa sinensis]
MQQSLFIAVSQIVMPQFSVEENTVYNYCVQQLPKLNNVLEIPRTVSVDHQEFADSMGPRGRVSTIVVLAASTIFMSHENNQIERRGKVYSKDILCTLSLR